MSLLKLNCPSFSLLQLCRTNVCIIVFLKFSKIRNRSTQILFNLPQRLVMDYYKANRQKTFFKEIIDSYSLEFQKRYHI